MSDRGDGATRSPFFPSQAVVLILVVHCVLLAGCSGPDEAPRTDPQYGALVTAAEGRFAAGQTERAVDSYGRALQRARAMDDDAAISDCAYNLAACLLSLGELDKARDYLLEARCAAERGGRSRLDALLLDAQIARLQNRAGDVAALCAEISRLADDDDESLWAFQVFLLEARVACDAGAKQESREKLDRALNLLDAIDDHHLRALAALVNGEVLLLEGSPAGAARSFEEQALNLRQGGRYYDMACALLRAGEAFLHASDATGAAECLFRAARSLFAQGEPDAQVAAHSARAAAQRANDPILVGRIDLLLLEIKAAENQSP